MKWEPGNYKLIINADDLGMSSSVNEAILLAFDKGLISSASLMTNMPGFEEACKAVKDRGLIGRIGVHINLIEGRPLTLPIRQCSRFCGEDGHFKNHMLKKAFNLPKGESAAVTGEIRRQVEICMDNGISPTHLDSHHHYHNSWPIGAIVVKVAKEYKIPAVRKSGIYGENRSLLQKLNRSAANLRLFLFGLARTQVSCSLVLAPVIIEKYRGIIEIVVHPRFDDSGKLIDLAVKKEFQPLIERFAGFECIPYPH